MPISSTWRTDRYDVNSANVNRQVTFNVQAAGGARTGTFLALKGPAHQYPHYHQIQGATDEQELAQIRLSLVVRAMSAYAVPIGVIVAADGSYAQIKYEQDEMGVFFNQTWAGLATDPKHSPEGDPNVGTADYITDTVGTGGAPNGAKEKPGLNLLVDALATVSFDGGTTGPFGALSTGATIVLPDGVAVTTTGAVAPAPELPVVGSRAAGLAVTWVGY